MLIADVPLRFQQDAPPLFEQLVSEAHAVLGVRRRTRRRTAVVVGTSVHAADEAQINQAQQQTAAQQQAADAEQEAAAAKQEAAAAKQPAAAATPPPPAADGKPLPLGTVVSALPAGCSLVEISGTQYYQCGADFYRAAFQENNLVYVTAKP
jgi:pyruvate/2-oxoglutarate dehydrogenase complex dihydrolipoamide acyltransferase (E2) component